LGESVGEVLSVEVAAFDFGSVLGVLAGGEVNLGVYFKELLVLPEGRVGINGAVFGGEDAGGGVVQSINLKEITGVVVALPC